MLMRIIVLLILIIGSLSSCTTAEFIQHTPTLANSGQHTDKNQFSGNLLYSSGSSTSNSIVNNPGPSPYEKVRGVQAQGSYSLSTSLVVQASYMHSDEEGGSINANQKNFVYDYSRNIAEGGLAYYKNLNQQRNTFIEIAAGSGLGSFKTTEANSILVPGGRYYNHQVLKLYLQPSVYYTSNNFCVSVGFKYAYINFNDIKTNYSDIERTNRSITTDDHLSTSTLDFFTKADVFLTKLPWLGLSLQFLRSKDLGKKFYLNQTDSNFGIGVRFRFNQLKEQIK
jgi:hypothetical protein